MKHKVLFKTVHGSRLYGLNHDDSDYDYYTVVDKVKTRKASYSTQTIIGENDSVVVDFGTWIGQCTIGVPQALEAMFSNMAVVDEISEFRNDFKTGTQVYSRYLRTIKSFAYADKDPYKRKRHAMRLAINMNQIRKDGRFNPTLTPAMARYISSVANLGSDEVYETALGLAWSL